MELRVAREEHNITFTLSDLTPGLPEDATEGLDGSLDPNIRFAGHGIGLVITRELCALMGGELLAERIAGSSPTYTMVLPDQV